MSLKNDETYSSRINVCKQHWKRSLLSRCIQIMKRFRTTCSKRPNSALQTFFACSLAGINAPVSKNILNYLKKEGLKEGPCRLFGTSYSSGLKEASLFNGVSSHCMDFDDVSWATIGHPSVSVAPSVFACAQKGKWNGKQTLLAYVLAVESMHQIARLTMPQLSERGWHTTLAYGVFGAAVPAVRLLGLNEDECANALGIAVSRAGGVRANFGTQTKALHAGLSNRIGIDCAEMAACGINASHNAVEGADGFALCFTGEAIKGEVDIGEFWDLHENGLVIKRYPCCSGTHPTNDVWDEFLSAHPLKAEDIDHIEAGVSLLGPKEMTCHLPQNAVQAKFSLEFALAYRLIFGKLSLSSFSDQNVLAPEIQAMMKKIKMEVSPELAKLGFIGTAPIRLKVYLKDGKAITLSNDLAVGNPEKPLPEQVVKEKFMDCSKGAADQEKAEKWYEILKNLENATQEEILSLGNP